MTKPLRCSGSRRTSSALLLMGVIGALPSGSRAADDSASIIQRIDQEVHQINSQLADGRAFAFEPKCEFKIGWCDFETAFMDREGHIRKIVDWSEGARSAIASNNSGAPETLRSIWEQYYDPEGEPIFIGGRYEDEPGSGRTQEHTYYIQNGKEIESREADGSIGPFHHEPHCNPKDDPVATARHYLQSVSKMLSEHRDKKSSP